MTDVVIVAIVGVAGTVSATLFGMIGNSVLENQRSKNERKAHIATARFNREFDMYQNLCEKHLTMVYDVGTAVMIARGAGLPERVQSNYEFVHLAAGHIDEAEMENKRDAPFISKEIFEDYKALGVKTYQAISMFDLWSRFDDMDCSILKYNNEQYTKKQALEELEKRQKEVSRCSDLILDIIRKHLEALGNQ